MIIILGLSANTRISYLDIDDYYQRQIEVAVNDGESERCITIDKGTTIKDAFNDNDIAYDQNYVDGDQLLNDKDDLTINDPAKSINLISEEDLAKLPYISEKDAMNIIIYRKQYGLFKSFDDLLNVKGIGENKLAILKEFLDL